MSVEVLRSPSQGEADPQTVSVIGLGAMGGAIACNLLAAGFRVSGFDVDSRRTELVEAAGGIGEQSAAAAAAADVVITSLPSEVAFEDAVLGAAGVIGAASRGTILLETSTLPIDLKERALKRLAPLGVAMLDCPLSGTGDQAKARDLIVLASGERSIVDRCVPVFGGFARAHYYVGAFGSGSKLKFVANLLVAIHNVAAAEALTLASAAGLDLEQTLRILQDSAGNSRMLEIRGKKMLARDYQSGVRTSLFRKDLAIIDEFAKQWEVMTPLLSLSSSLYAAAAARGYGEQDTASVYEVFAALES
jgi:3-hydroxyisobutyrate dehydrogenase-like beta-hydroxyacid dehydrogenase